MTNSIIPPPGGPRSGDEIQVVLCPCGCNAVVLSIHKDGEGPLPLAFFQMGPEDAVTLAESLSQAAALSAKATQLSAPQQAAVH